MIQRTQTIYLILTTILAGLFLTGNIFEFVNREGSEFVMNISGLIKFQSDENFLLITKTLPVLVVSVMIPVISLITIFLYRNRKLQIKITISLAILNLLLIALTAYYGFTAIRQYDGTLVPVFRMFIPVVSVIILLLAFRGIKKDENLIKSYERLR